MQIKDINNINLNNSLDNILKKRLLATDKRKNLNDLFIKQGLTRTQAIKTTEKILWIYRHKARA
jgi:hypothetical protein